MSSGEETIIRSHAHLHKQLSAHGHTRVNAQTHPTASDEEHANYLSLTRTLYKSHVLSFI